MMNSTSEKNKAAKRRRRGRTAGAIAVLLIFLAMAGFMAYLAWSELTERQDGDGYYETLAGQIASATRQPAPTAQPGPTIVPLTLPPSPLDTARPTEAPSCEPTEEPAETIAPAVGSRIDFDTLRLTCPDAVGWITLKDSTLDYPIVQGRDNDWYLNHLPDGTRNEAGSIMMDAACNRDFQSEITILHGHHMRSGAMFGNLDLYCNEGYYEEHPVMELCTPEGDYEVQIFAGWTLNAETFDYVTGFNSDEAFDRYIKKALSKSVFKADVEVQRGDRLLMLSTCAYQFESARFVLLGKIVEHEPAVITE